MSIDLLGTLSGRIPPTLEKKIKEILAEYEKNLHSVMCKFPAQKIANAIDQCAAAMGSSADHKALFLVTSDLFQLMQGYRNGVRGHLLFVIEKLVRSYLDVERLFCLGQSRVGFAFFIFKKTKQNKNKNKKPPKKQNQKNKEKDLG